MTVQAHKRRFGELLAQLRDVQKRFMDSDGRKPINQDLFIGWRVKARHLLSQACGAGSVHYTEFRDTEETTDRILSDESRLLRLMAIFEAAKEDYEGGYLRSTRSLVHAELFDDELELASELLASGYRVAAAVSARVVLETTIRKLCGDRNIPVKMPDGKPVKLDKLNSDLAKAGVYALLVQKRVTWLAGIGNDAAHGKPVKDADAEAMIEQVRRFVTDHPTA